MINFTIGSDAAIPNDATDTADPATPSPETVTGEVRPSLQEVIEDTLDSLTPVVALLLSRLIHDRATRVRLKAKPSRPSLPLRLALGASAHVTRTGRAVRAFLMTYDRRLLAEECPLCVVENASPLRQAMDREIGIPTYTAYAS